MSEPLRVLMLEDRASDARLVIAALKEAAFNPQWERVDTVADFAAKLADDWDIILADYSLPQCDALQALAVLRGHPSKVPLIIVSGTIGEETAVAAMKQGAADYLLKDRLARLGQAVRQAIEQRRMLENQLKTELALVERTRLTMLTAEVGLALSRAGTLREVLQDCAESLHTQLELALARIWTLDTEERIATLKAGVGSPPLIVTLDSTVPFVQLEAACGGRAVQRSPESLQATRPEERRLAERAGVRSLVVHPLVVENRTVGCLELFARRELTPGDLDTVTAVANHLGAGIERKRTEERLKFTQFTIDHVATPVLWADAEGRFFNVNHAACKLTGYSRAELLTLHVFNVYPQRRDGGWQSYWRELQERAVLSGESSLRRKDGSFVPVSMSANLLRIDGRECSCTFLQDISERKQAEDERQRSELRFREIFNHLQLQIQRMPLGYILFDADLKLVDWNPAAVTIFEYERDEVCAMSAPFARITPPDFWTSDGPTPTLRADIAAGHVIHEGISKSGRPITCEWISTPLETEDGRFSGLMCLVRDVTERRRLEEQFRQSQKMEAVGRLAGGVAHDFNNLLTVVLGYSEVLRETLREGDPIRDAVDQIHRAGTRAAGLTRQLLSFSRKQVLSPVVLDLNALLADMEKMLRRLIGEDVELEVRPCRELWRARADMGQIEQVVMNLAVNSRDAMPRGGRLTIETANVTLDKLPSASHPSARPESHVMLKVTDTGCGMSPETRARIFEPFFSTKGDLGTGLGLATVYGIVQQSGGKIEVETKPGRGTSFNIYLPRVVGEPGPATIQADVNKRLRGRETILLVEDEDGVRSLARFALERQGYKVIEARLGGEALLSCERYSDKIDLLITDVVMPQMSGRELSERLLTLRPALKVLYMSGYMDDAVVRHGLMYSDVPFLQKPFSPEALARKVREVLDDSTN